jgi:hypothetical protein
VHTAPLVHQLEQRDPAAADVVRPDVEIVDVPLLPVVEAPSKGQRRRTGGTIPSQLARLPNRCFPPNRKRADVVYRCVVLHSKHGLTDRIQRSVRYVIDPVNWQTPLRAIVAIVRALGQHAPSDTVEIGHGVRGVFVPITDLDLEMTLREFSKVGPVAAQRMNMRVDDLQVNFHTATGDDFAYGITAIRDAIGIDARDGRVTLAMLRAKVTESLGADVLSSLQPIRITRLNQEAELRTDADLQAAVRDLARSTTTPRLSATYRRADPGEPTGRDNPAPRTAHTTVVAGLDLVIRLT